MEFERHVFTSAAQLLAEARKSVAEGLYHRVTRDDDEPALLWLDRFAARRSDWHAVIAATLAHLADEGGDAGTAVVDWFDRGVTGPAFVAAGEAILAKHPQLASNSEQALDPQAEPLPLGTVLPRLQQAAARFHQKAQHLLLRSPTTAIVAFADRADLLREARVAALQAESRLQGGIDGWYTLDFLRQLAFFVPWVRKELPAVLADLAETDVAGARAAVQYAVHAGDPDWLLPRLHAWNEASPQWFGAAAEFALAPAATLGACVKAAIAAAEAQEATAPT